MIGKYVVVVKIKGDEKQYILTHNVYSDTLILLDNPIIGNAEYKSVHDDTPTACYYLNWAKTRGVMGFSPQQIESAMVHTITLVGMPDLHKYDMLPAILQAVARKKGYRDYLERYGDADLKDEHDYGRWWVDQQDIGDAIHGELTDLV